MNTVTTGHAGAGELTPQVLRTAFAAFPSGVTAVAAMVDGRPMGMAASSFTSVSLEPALVSVCVAHTSSTWKLLAAAPRIGVSVLAEHHGETARSLAARGEEKFANVEWSADEAGAIFIHDSALWLRCSIHDAIAVGDHDIVVLEVESLDRFEGVAPMVFHGSGFHGMSRGTKRVPLRNGWGWEFDPFS
ncbi:flavin reductase family protein [Nocardioides sp. BP30]|uniref:flavin reductase family protein n=1 Tax=Nocardioides sp. BP30 TaxID=3036374 RepID=UPI0024688C86|nr:flavin reductase family protein [Nocardioides sp. BP30]WGL54144.1 flavin reductase family protein [Nocardioides sp. BP30]